MKIPETVKKIAKIFKNSGYQLYLVGGAIRDSMLGGDLVDYDFATNATPEEVAKLFKKVIPVGIEHGTVLVLFENHEYEITTFRTDGKYSDNRHPDSVSFVRNIEEDLKRRDFTINAFAYDISDSQLVDLFGGREDLENKIIRAIGTPSDRFQEDALRMIRGCRFASKLNFNIEQSTFEAMKENAALIKNVSSERIREEFIKIMATPKPSIAIELMRLSGLLEYILPELLTGYGVIQNKFHKYDVYYHNLYTCDAGPVDNYIVRLAALFHDIAKPQTVKEKDEENNNSFYNHEIIGAKISYRILKRLKFPKIEIDRITHLIRYHMFYYTEEWTDGAVRRFLRNVGVENLGDLFLLRDADREGNGTKQGVPKTFIEFKNKIAEIIEKDNALKVTDLEINGNDIMKRLGIAPGKIIGEILEYLLELVLDEPELNTHEKLIELADTYYKNRSQNNGE